jgi:hypothetical protein
LLTDHSLGTGSVGGVAQPAKNNSAPQKMIPRNLNTQQFCGTRKRTQAVSDKSKSANPASAPESFHDWGKRSAGRVRMGPKID